VPGPAQPPATAITDPGDRRLDLYRHLTDADARRSLEAEHGVFVVEGVTAIERLLRSEYRVRSLLVLASQAQRLAPALALAGHDVPVYIGSRELLAATAGFDVHRGALAIAERRALPPVEDVLRGAGLVTVLEGLTDPENLGAIARSARALGVDALLLNPTCADPLYRRAVRVSMGEVLFVPWTRLSPWPGGLARVRAAGITLVALTPAPDAVPIDDLVRSAPARRLADLLGTEGPGLSDAALAACDVRVRIPIRAGVDSLNVGHAAAVAFHVLGRRAAGAG
jgi:tRNA G18 (ribose-2'-O)-methylase SpoU